MKKILLMLLLCIAIAGCSQTRTNINLGQDDAATIDNKTEAAQPTTKKPTKEYATQYPTINPSLVYWVPNGEVYHSTDKCSYISGKNYIQKGTVKEAEAAGKNRPCSRCGK